MKKAQKETKRELTVIQKECKVRNDMTQKIEDGTNDRKRKTDKRTYSEEGAENERVQKTRK